MTDATRRAGILNGRSSGCSIIPMTLARSRSPRKRRRRQNRHLLALQPYRRSTDSRHSSRTRARACIPGITSPTFGWRVRGREMRWRWIQTWTGMERGCCLMMKRWCWLIGRAWRSWKSWHTCTCLRGSHLCRQLCDALRSTMEVPDTGFERDE